MLVYERSPEFLNVLTEALFGAPAAPQLGRLARTKDRVLAWAENLLGPAALIVTTVVGLAFVAVMVLLPVYLVAWPFRWAGAETMGLWVQNGLALFTLFGLTMAMLGQSWGRCKDARQVSSVHVTRGRR